MKSPSADAFRQLYTELQMERDGLFAAVARAYRCQTVLYPGCSIHVNPSFHFPHVVYVDTSDTARRFFAAAADVLRLIEDRKRYARPPHVRFLPLDFTRSLPLRDASFDLVLALHAGGIARACGRYLRPGGLLISNNHQDDAGQAARATPGAYQLVAVIHERESRYVIDRERLDGYFVPRLAPDPAYVRESSPWPAYTRNADYYVFRRTDVRAS